MYFAISAYRNYHKLKSNFGENEITIKTLGFCWGNAKQHTVEEARLTLIY